MSLISNLTTKSVNPALLAIVLSLLCQTVSAQLHYPLHATSGNKPVVQTNRQLPISDLPTMPTMVGKENPSEPKRTVRSAGARQTSMTDFFDAAYGEPAIDRTNDFDPSSGAMIGDNSTTTPLSVEHHRIGGGGDFSRTNNNEFFLQHSESEEKSNTWWKQRVPTTIGKSVTEQPVDTNSLVYATLQNSPRIRALSQNPLIREQQIIEADSDFDSTSFVRSLFEDRVDPIGNVLSGVPDGILNDNIWTGEFGIRRKLRTGATYELGEKLGFKNSNSSFFDPQDQATATLALNVTQPLLRGRGRYYNQSQILIAQSASGAAWDTFAAELQDEIQETVRAYWELYSNRSSYLQKQRNFDRGVQILEILEARRNLDSLPSQILRARSAVSLRKIALANALRDIRDSETQLRRITADRDWKGDQNREMIPTEIPTTDGLDIGLEQVVLTAIEHRPEIKETMARAKIAAIQRDVSENELLPELSLLLGTYVSALQGDSQMGQAIQDQFGEVTPGYTVGFEFEFPFRNRAARSQFAQSQLRLAKIRSEVDETILNVIAESQISLRRVRAAKETLDSAFQAIEAARADLEQTSLRWESFALIEGDIADGQTPTTALDQLLDSQERLTAAELVFTQAELELKTAEIELQRSMGTLLIHENVTFGKACNGRLPELIIDKSENVDSSYGEPMRQSVPDSKAPGINW